MSTAAATTAATAAIVVKSRKSTKAPASAEPKVPGTKRTRVSKALKPEHVPRGRTAYIIWCHDNRAELAKEHPDASFTDLAKLLGEKWKALSDDDKKVYNRKAAQEQAERPIDVTAEKLFASHFRSKERKANPEVDTADLNTRASAAWLALNDKDRDSWNQKESKARAKVEAARAAALAV